MKSSPSLLWESVSLPPPLEENHVHVWRILLDVLDKPATPHWINAEQSLSDDERARAARYHFERDRIRYLRGRAVLRLLLGQYLNSSPAHITFSYTAPDKPFVRGRVPFNLSHADDWMLVAIASDIQVDVDVETARAGLNLLDIAARFFSPIEYRALVRLPEPERLDAFLESWTRKEALGKALGTGIEEILSKPPSAQ